MFRMPTDYDISPDARASERYPLLPPTAFLDDALGAPLPRSLIRLTKDEAIARFGEFARGCNGALITITYRAAKVGERWEAFAMQHGKQTSVPVVSVSDVRFF